MISEEFQKEILKDINKWKREPDSDLQLPGAVVRYRPKENYLSIDYLTRFGVLEFPIDLKPDESDSQSTAAAEMEVEIHDDYSIKYNRESDILFIRFGKIGFAIPLESIRFHWDIIRK